MPAISCCPAASALSASWASTASGVFNPWARSPAFANARRTVRSRCSSKELRSFTKGCTSIGYDPSTLRPVPSRTPDSCLRSRLKEERPVRTCQIPATMQKNENIRVSVGSTRAMTTRPGSWWCTVLNIKCTSGTSPKVQRKAPRRMRQRKECTQFMNPLSCDNQARARSE